MEPKSMFLSEKFLEKTFVGAEIHENWKILAVTADSLLCLFNEQTRQLDRWMDLKAASTFAVTVLVSEIICASSDSIIRIFSADNLSHMTTLHSNRIPNKFQRATQPGQVQCREELPQAKRSATQRFLCGLCRGCRRQKVGIALRHLQRPDLIPLGHQDYL